jgi:glycine/D-amino acid oxidase-like deaminating enzyme
VRTELGRTVRAERVLLATNGYTGGLWPGLEQTVLAANSFMIATEPLRGTAAGAILPGRETASNTQRLLLYFRRDAQGRLLMGGCGHFAEPYGPHSFEHLVRSVELLFPQLGPVKYEYRWAGRVAITRDFLPHVHEPAPGLTMALGYNGRGVATATAMGQHLAARMTGTTEFPFPGTRIKPIPPARNAALLHRGGRRLVLADGSPWLIGATRVELPLLAGRGQRAGESALPAGR